MTDKHLLTRAQIARDISAPAKSSAAWLGVVLCLIFSGILLAGMGLELIPLIPLAPIPLFAFLIVRKWRKGKAVEQQVLAGDFHLIRCPLYDKQRVEGLSISSDDIPDFTYHLYFNYHPEPGRYRQTVSFQEYTRAQVNGHYFVVLRQNGVSLQAAASYRAAENTLDEDLSAILTRDQDMTGSPLTHEQESAIAHGEWQALTSRSPLTPEEEEALRPDFAVWEKKGLLLAAIAAAVGLSVMALMLLLMFIGGRETFRGLAWYWRLLITLAYAGLGVLPFFRHFAWYRRIGEYEYRTKLATKLVYGGWRTLCMVTAGMTLLLDAFLIIFLWVFW